LYAGLKISYFDIQTTKKSDSMIHWFCSLSSLDSYRFACEYDTHGGVKWGQSLWTGIY